MKLVFGHLIGSPLRMRFLYSQLKDYTLLINHRQWRIAKGSTYPSPVKCEIGEKKSKVKIFKKRREKREGKDDKFSSRMYHSP